MFLIKTPGDDEVYAETMYAEKYKPLLFKCTKCVCTFLATKDEYRSRWFHEDYKTNCPHCGSKVFRSWWASDSEVCEPENMDDAKVSQGSENTADICENIDSDSRANVRHVAEAMLSELNDSANSEREECNVLSESDAYINKETEDPVRIKDTVEDVAKKLNNSSNNKKDTNVRYDPRTEHIEVLDDDDGADAEYGFYGALYMQSMNQREPELNVFALTMDVLRGNRL